ncbi:MAG: ABC transporter ATP-binding protein [Candidatus Tectomicrobia bacterium]|nr:ABC transporter ATP-binding protein [Candidatus Tectomicrobia bacterium]
MNSAKVEIRDVTKAFRSTGGSQVTALAGISLRIPENEFLTVVGPSGCGKSTLLYIIGGFLKATRGEVLVNGVPVTGPGADRGIVFQKYSLFPWRTVMQNITYGLEEQGVPRAERQEIARSYLRLMRLEGFERAYPRALSGGMQQRVALAQTLACEPDIILMDEPFGALDAQTRKLMQVELLRLWEQRRTTIIFVTHDVEEAIYLGTRVIVMTARPGTVKHDEPIALNIARDKEDYMLNRAFMELKMRIWLNVKEEVERYGEVARS